MISQGEQLDNVERKTHAINQDLKQSQRSLNGIKSVFGNLKNWWSGNKEDEATKRQREIPEKNSSLRGAVDNIDLKPGQHPAFRLRQDDYQGFYDEADSSQAGSQQREADGWAPQEEKSLGAPRQQQQQSRSTSNAQYEARMDENMGKYHWHKTN